MRKIFNAQTLENEAYVGQVGSLNLWNVEVRQLTLVRKGGVYPEALAWLRSSCTTGALHGGSFAHRGDLQGLNSCAGVVRLLLLKAGVNYVNNAVNGEGGLRNIGSDNDLACTWRGRLKNFSLLV